MKYFSFLLFYFYCATLFSQNKGIRFNYPLHNPPDSIYYFYEANTNSVKHHLNFYNDTMFHITVPNNSGSCHTWGEYGGKIKIKGDAIVFFREDVKLKDNLRPTRRNFKKNSSYETIVHREIFVFKNNYNTLERISEQQFMLSKYNLESFNKGK